MSCKPASGCTCGRTPSSRPKSRLVSGETSKAVAGSRRKGCEMNYFKPRAAESTTPLLASGTSMRSVFVRNFSSISSRSAIDFIASSKRTITSSFALRRFFTADSLIFSINSGGSLYPELTSISPFLFNFIQKISVLRAQMSIFFLTRSCYESIIRA